MYEVLKTLKKYEQTEQFCVLIVSKLQQGTNGGPHLKSALRGGTNATAINISANGKQHQPSWTQQHEVVYK